MKDVGIGPSTLSRCRCLLFYSSVLLFCFILLLFIHLFFASLIVQTCSKRRFVKKRILSQFSAKIYPKEKHTISTEQCA